MPSNLLVDAGAFVALIDANDDLHEQAAAFYRALPVGIRQLTPQPLVGETYTFLRYHHAQAMALRWLDFVDRARASGHLASSYPDETDAKKAT